jgi:ABC-type lipoprotein release transport system permease subunit
MVMAGSLAGLALGLMSVHYVETLLYQVQPKSLPMLTSPLAVIVVASFVAALPAVVRAVRIDPSSSLRSE